MLLQAAESKDAIPLWLVSESQLPDFLSQLEAQSVAWLAAHAFQAERARVMTIPGPRGGVAAAVAGLGAASEAAPSLWDAAACAERLPAGRYALAKDLPAPAATQFALGR